MAGVISAVAGIAFIALAVVLKRRRDSKEQVTQIPGALSTHDEDNVELGTEKSTDVKLPSYATVLAMGNADDKPPFPHTNAALHRQTPTGASGVDGEDTAPPSAPASTDGRQARPSAERASNAAKARGTGLTSEVVAGRYAENVFVEGASSTTASTADMSSPEREELHQFRQRQQRVADAATSVAAGPKLKDASGDGAGTSSAASRRKSAGASAGAIGLGQAVLAAAQELAHHCQIPGVSEAASAVCIIANLVADGRDNGRANEARLRQCSTIVLALKRAAKVADRVS